MKILDMHQNVTEVIDTDDEDFPTWRRCSADYWENLMGSSWEESTPPRQLEEAYREYKKETPGAPTKKLYLSTMSARNSSEIVASSILTIARNREEALGAAYVEAREQWDAKTYDNFTCGATEVDVDELMENLKEINHDNA